MSIRSATVNVPAPQTTYPSTPSFDAGFAGTMAVVLMTAAPAECWISFDGLNDAVHLVAGGPAVSFATQRDYASVWIRGSGAAVDVQVVAETDEE